jgi:ABC-2 type transport system ATP-binding protein
MDINIKNLVKDFGSKRAVDIDRYTVKSGEMIGLVGNNGAGKTTLFRLILDLLKRDEGEITIGEWSVNETELWKNYTGTFIDDSFLIDYLTPEEFFYFVGKMYNISKSDIDEKLEKFTRFMNDEVMDTKKLIRNFSAGNKQKIGIIAAMLHDPKILILDEPFNFLDPTSQSVIKHMLKDYNERTGATIIISSHNLNHTVDICKRIALLEHGKIIRDIDNSDYSAGKELEDYFEVKE